MKNDLRLAINTTLNTLQTAEKQLADARTRLQTAYLDESQAILRVDEAQKALDAFTAELKKDAPHGTHWARRPGGPA
ncbi:MAG: hypothetical protein YHS30scaffold667_53 [Phage 65_10]|nr:MAG: hypothetical protein YHS30scaffold667_53 [Phage 65_10]